MDTQEKRLALDSHWIIRLMNDAMTSYIIADQSAIGLNYHAY